MIYGSCRNIARRGGDDSHGRLHGGRGIFSPAASKNSAPQARAQCDRNDDEEYNGSDDNSNDCTRAQRRGSGNVWTTPAIGRDATAIIALPVD